MPLQSGGMEIYMKYSVEGTNNGYVETLEINGKIYKKHWISVDGDLSCTDDIFCHQMEKDGYDMEILTTVGADIDCSFFECNKRFFTRT